MKTPRVAADVRSRTNHQRSRLAFRRSTPRRRKAYRPAYRMAARLPSGSPTWSCPPNLTNQLSRLAELILKFYETEPLLITTDYH